MENVTEPETAVESVAPLSTRRLVLAATEAFAERGFHGTTTRDIAARADLSAAAIYMHYRSKAALLYLIMRDIHNDILSEMQEALDARDEPEERLEALIRTHVRFHAERHTAARVANHELPALAARDRAEIMKIRDQIERLVDETLAQGAQAGAFAVRDVRATTFLILSIGIGVSRWFRPDGRLSPDELGDLYADLVVRMVRSVGAPP